MMANKVVKVRLPEEVINWLEEMGGARRYLIYQYDIYQRQRLKAGLPVITLTTQGTSQVLASATINLPGGSNARQR